MRLFPFVRGGTLHTAIPAGPQSWQPLSRRKEEAIKKKKRRDGDTQNADCDDAMSWEKRWSEECGWLETKARK